MTIQQLADITAPRCCLDKIGSARYTTHESNTCSSSARLTCEDTRVQARNEACHCGSGRRYKHCHGQLPRSGFARERVDFVVAGTQKGGTTTLDLYLREHPRISMATRKEVHFFDIDENFRTEAVDYAVYHANFAARSPLQLYGECTPMYMYWEPAAARMARYNPALKIVIILRNPITRAYSHWNMEREKCREALPFLEAVQTEPDRAQQMWPRQLRHRAYVHRGFYARQL